MRTRAALLSVAVTLMLAPGVVAGPLSDVPRVRPHSDAAATLIAEAQKQSPTVRDLFKRMENGDVVAYVQVVPASPGAPESTLVFLGASKLARFVVIQVADCQAPCRGIELLGHELQHAVDMAAAAWVTDDAQLQRMLSLTGWRDGETARGYETLSAMRVERQVHRDVRGVTRPVQ